MYRVLKTQLKVNKEQSEYIDTLIWERNKCWNELVEEFNPRYKNKKYPSKTELNRFLKEKHPNLRANVLQQVWMDYVEAWNQVYKIKSRKEPIFHSIKRVNSVKCNTNNGLNIINNIFYLSKEHRIELCEDFPNKPSRWMCKFTLSRRCGKYYVSFVWKEEEVSKIENQDNQIGLDYGIKDFFTDNNGINYNLPKSLFRQIQRIKSIQKIISSKYQRNAVQSNNWKKVNNKLSLAWARYNNIKKDWIEKLTYKLCSENKLIAIEKLNIDNMRKGQTKNNRQKMNHNCFSLLINRLKQKIERFVNVTVYECDTFYPSSQICSCCGIIHKEMKNLKNRKIICECGYENDRDINAAINLLNKAKLEITSSI